MNLYVLSGLGADRSVFKKIIFPPNHTIQHLDWIPFLPGETLKSYAMRIAAPIPKDEPFVLLGLSFGGMLAIEIAAVYHPAKTILLSSVPKYSELPFRYRVAGKLGLHHLIPTIKPTIAMRPLAKMFGVEAAHDSETFADLIKNSDSVFIKAAIRAILSWRRNELLPNIVRIHGTRDKILPPSKL